MKATPNKLTRAQRRVLTQMRDAEYPDNELICDGLECWIGRTRTSWRVVNALCWMMAISDCSDENGCPRFAITETGVHILKDESNVEQVINAARKGGAWTWRFGVLTMMETPR